MIAVGIIANPASGKDIRRLVAHGSVFDNHEKANIVGRVLLGLDSVGVERAWIMPDSFGIGARALDGLRLDGLRVSVLDMPVTFTSTDTQRAAARMVDDGVGCLITLGGDGTNRLVAGVGANVPLMPISTGTNNVFPTMVEGTLAGIAAGLVAGGVAAVAVRRMPLLEIHSGGSPGTVALVDAAVCDERFIGARALWDPSGIVEVVLARVEAGSIGLSSIGAHLGLASPVHLRMGVGGRRVSAPIGPGLIAQLCVTEQRLLEPGDQVRICQPRACTLALDGEREIALRGGAEVCVRLRAEGPRVVDIRQALSIAARAGVFVGESG